MKKEIKKVYTVNIIPSVMEKAKEKAVKEKRSLSAYVEFLIENDLKKGDLK